MKYLVAFLGLALAWSLTATIGVAHDRSVSVDQSYSIITVVNQDQFQGKWKQFKGDLKQRWGKFTDDDLMQIEGDWDKYEGKMQERYGDRREEVKRWTEDWFDRYDDTRTDRPRQVPTP